MAGQFPTSFRDPLYASLDEKVTQKLGLPVGLLPSIRENGERTDHGRVSSAGATTPYQFIPATREAILKKYGIDVTLSPENAAEGAGLLLKESLDRNKGDKAAAVGEYIGGTDRKNWGPVTQAYIGRVVPAAEASADSLLLNELKAWKERAPVQTAPPAREKPADTGPVVTPDLIEAAKAWKASRPPEPGFIDQAKDVFTGNLRATPATVAAPDWASMPELNQLSLASAKTGLGTILANPGETAQIIQANFPDAKVRQDEKGNYLITSPSDGIEYAIKPGFQVSDIPRALAGLGAFSPAGAARTIAGSGLAAAGTQAVIEGTQAAAGGQFNPAEVAIAGAIGGAVPAAARLAGIARDAGTGALRRLRGVDEAVTSPAASTARAGVGNPPDPTVQPAPATAGVAATDARSAAAAAAPDAPPAPRPAIDPMTSSELNETARTAAMGGLRSGRATQVLAEQAAPDATTLAAAKRLGIEDHLQPDHLTTNQAYREFAQAVKSIPGSEARSAEVAGLDAVAKRADQLIGDIGGTTDVSTLNASIRARMQATHTELEEQANRLYAQVREQIPAKTTAPVENTVAFLKAHADEVGGAKNLLPVERKLLAALNGDKPPTYAFLDQQRQAIGQAMQKASGPFADSNSGLLKKLYSTLSDDQQAVANSVGAGELFTAAKAAVAVRKGLEDDLASLFGRTLEGSIASSLPGAVRAVAAGDTSRLVKLVQAVPPEMRQEVVASGVATAFRTAATRGEINFGTYAKWYDGLMRNRQAYAAVMSNLPLSARKQLHALYRVSQGISASSRERITTGRIMAVMDDFKPVDTLAGRLYETASQSAIGATVGTAVGSAASAVIGPAGFGVGAAVASALTKGAKPSAIKAADALITSPEFIQLAKAATSGTESAKAAAARRFAYSQVFTRYARAVGNPREMSNRERWILNAMQSRNNNSQELH